MHSPHDPLLTLDEAGDLLGTGPDLPARLIADGQLDHAQEDDEIRVRQSALIAYVTAIERRRADSPARLLHDRPAGRDDTVDLAHTRSPATARGDAA
jgi:hypothetical protein